MAMNALSDATQKMVAEWQIRDVVARYARGVDRRDGAIIRECFHPGALTHYGDFDGIVDDLVPWVLAYVASYPHTMHFMGLSIVDWASDASADRAVVETYAAVLHEKDGHEGGRSWVGGIRYIDRFECRTVSDGSGAVWRIAERSVVGDWLRIDPTDNHRRFSKEMVTGQDGREDLIFQTLSKTFGQ
jgi:hypothetical protein